MNQNFSPEEVIKLCKKTELIEYGLTKTALLELLSEAYEKILSDTYEYVFLRHKNYYYASDLVNKLILRKLNSNIKKLYKDKQANRNLIVYQIKTLLEDQCPLYILRTDISSFYASISQERLLEKLKGDSMLSYFSIRLIEKIFSNKLLSEVPGLPQGVPISSTLSELYMRRFDKAIRGFDGIYYYARFVDDIIIFNYSRKQTETLVNALDSMLETGLNKNLKKTSTFDGSLLRPYSPLEFLGYKFYFKKTDKKSKEMVISIADSKVKKIKTRIILSFVDFVKTREELLLIKRIQFLTGNYNLKSSIEGVSLKAGIFYNYIHANDTEVFHQLNLFYHKTLNSRRNSLGVKLAPLLSPALKSQLQKYSFAHGFNKKVFYRFDAATMKNISNCWR
ncbi:MAG: maturase protein [Sphingobacteriaceae bacterium]|jgi:hypothetical protein|nr:maturase protein [Sphingobacteriaceae bacterium]